MTFRASFTFSACSCTALLLAIASAQIVGCSDDAAPQLEPGAEAGVDGTSPPPPTSPPGAVNDSGSSDTGARDSGVVEGKHRVIVFVWDGLRPDSINATDTPNLDMLRKSGVDFRDNHSTYPTFTMINASAFATGAFPGKTGFYGNTVYQPGPGGKDSTGAAFDFSQPVFLEDWALLTDLDAYYSNQLLLVGTLFKAAQTAGLTTCAIGKSGAAFLQDYKRGGLILDERHAWPATLANDLFAAHYPVPKLSNVAYDGGLAMDAANGDPTASQPTVKLSTEPAAVDPTATNGSPPTLPNHYLLHAFTDVILPKYKPDLTLVWMRNPDSTEHAYGVGTAAYKAALAAQDVLLGQLVAQLTNLGMQSTTDLVVVSDHGHSNVSGPLALFPTRAIRDGGIQEVADGGYSVSGDVRLAHLMTLAGFQAFDGTGCAYSPALSGMLEDGGAVYPTQIDSTPNANDAGAVCKGAVGAKYSTPSYKVPAVLPTNAVVIAANGGSDYLYVPSHDPTTVADAVRFLQSREEIGAIFVAGRYGALAGTLPLSNVNLENTAGRHPDIVVSYAYDENAVLTGMKGIEFESMFNNRGMHGSFSPIDVHNTLIAAGPSFKMGFSDTLPTGNVDVAPTVAKTLNLTLSDAQGRVLFEALTNGGASIADYTITENTTNAPSPATGLTMKLPIDPSGGAVDGTKTQYTTQVKTKTVTRNGQSHTYFDWAKGVRQ